MVNKIAQCVNVLRNFNFSLSPSEATLLDSLCLRERSREEMYDNLDLTHLNLKLEPCKEESGTFLFGQTIKSVIFNKLSIHSGDGTHLLSIALSDHSITSMMMSINNNIYSPGTALAAFEDTFPQYQVERASTFDIAQIEVDLIHANQAGWITDSINELKVEMKKASVGKRFCSRTIESLNRIYDRGNINAKALRTLNDTISVDHGVADTEITNWLKNTAIKPLAIESDTPTVHMNKDLNPILDALTGDQFSHQEKELLLKLIEEVCFRKDVISDDTSITEDDDLSAFFSGLDELKSKITAEESNSPRQFQDLALHIEKYQHSYTKDGRYSVNIIDRKEDGITLTIFAGEESDDRSERRLSVTSGHRRFIRVKFSEIDLMSLIRNNHDDFTKCSTVYFLGKHFDKTSRYHFKEDVVAETNLEGTELGSKIESTIKALQNTPKKKADARSLLAILEELQDAFNKHVDDSNSSLKEESIVLQKDLTEKLFEKCHVKQEQLQIFIT